MGINLKTFYKLIFLLQIGFVPKYKLFHLNIKTGLTSRILISKTVHMRYSHFPPAFFGMICTELLFTENWMGFYWRVNEDLGPGVWQNSDLANLKRFWLRDKIASVLTIENFIKKVIDSPLIPKNLSMVHLKQSLGFHSFSWENEMYYFLLNNTFLISYSS